MYIIDFNKPVSVYFVGIGGISMSGLAEILHEKGFRVSGSDRQKSPLTEGLEAKGITVLYGQKKSNITPDLDCVVFTSAIHPDNPEYMATQELNIPMLTRAELLGQIMKNYRTAVAVSGTHGKTTTTSLISEILLNAQLDPTLSIGGVLRSIGGNIKIGHSPYFVTEACEYTNSFLSFFPTVGLILNIEEDHLDFFKDLEDIRNSFRKFAQLLPENGTLIINGEIERLSEITEGLSCKVITFGHDDSCDYYPTDISYNDMGCGMFTLHTPSGESHSVSLRIPGEHNILNALAAFALSDTVGVAPSVATEAMGKFTGADRRFEYKGTIGGVNIVDDYAHHPTEIAATLKAAANYPHKTLWCVFQPHTYTRTKAFMDDFAKSLCLADKVVLADIYASRETDTLGISSRILKDKVTELGGECYYFPSFDEIENFLLLNCNHGDLLITMGAGDVHKIGEYILGE